METLGDLDGGARLSRASAISTDGSSIVGTSHSQAGKEAFLWQAETGMLGLGDLPNGIFSSVGSSVSEDGRYVVGTSQSILGVRTAARAFRWTREAGMLDLGLPSGARAARAFDLSEDGGTIVGQVTGEQGRLAYVWTVVRDEGEGPNGKDANKFTGESLGDLPGGRAESVATATSGDATFVVGTAHGRRGPEAFRWTQKTGLKGLGFLQGGGYQSRAEDVSEDGSHVVGSAASERGQRAFLWTHRQGMRALEAVLASEGVALPEGWRLERADGISRDGRTIVGSGTNPRGDREAWAIFWPPAPESH
jgi:probable HAF family extracellular repeat protein